MMIKAHCLKRMRAGKLVSLFKLLKLNGKHLRRNFSSSIIFTFTLFQGLLKFKKFSDIKIITVKIFQQIKIVMRRNLNLNIRTCFL